MKRCLEVEEIIMQDQASFQIILSDHEYEENILFKPEYHVLTEQLRGMFGLDEMFLYQLNFSMN